MPFYEILFETGRMSLAQYEDDEEAQRALGEHDRRARTGEGGGPVEGHPAGLDGAPTWAAERVAKVYVYEAAHPDEYNVEQTMSADVLKSETASLIDALADDNDVVNVAQVALEVRALTHPMSTDAEREGQFASMYRMEEDRELDLAFLEGSAA